MQEHLARSDAAEITRNHFRLCRPSGFAEFELRVEDWCVFYRVVRREVHVALIGRKRGDRLVVGGRKFIL